MDDIDRQIEELKEKLDFLREQMPITPLDAERKAMDIGLLEEQLAELYEQKKGNTTMPRSVTPDKDSLTEEIKSITDELMEIEIKMIKAEMSANALKARRQTLIDEVREINSAPIRSEKDDLLLRVEALEKEVADLKTLLYQLLTRQ